MPNSSMRDKSEEFAHAQTFGLIVKYSLPTIVGMLANALYVLIDRVFVGHLPGGTGELGIAGITVAQPVTTILFAVAMLAGAGGAANISLSLGRGERDKAEEYIGNSVTLSVVMSALLCVGFAIFADPILIRFGASADVLPYARSYLLVMLLGGVINTLGYTLSRTILAQGFTTIAMTMMFVGVGVNIVLAPLFLFVFHWGVGGSALATVIAQLCSMLFSLSYFLRHRLPLRLRVKNLRPQWKTLVAIVSIGISPCALQLAMSLVQAIMNNSLLRYGGDVAVAAIGTVMAVSAVLMMPIFGINQGAQPIIGFNYGAQLYDRVRRLLVQSILLATAVIVVFWAVLMIGAEKAILLFGSQNADLMREGPVAMRLYLLALPVVGFQVVSSNYFQSVGKPAHSLVLSLSRQVLLLIPAVLLLPLWLGIRGVYLAGPVADVLASLITAVFFALEMRQLARRHEERARLPEEPNQEPDPDAVS